MWVFGDPREPSTSVEALLTMFDFPSFACLKQEKDTQGQDGEMSRCPRLQALGQSDGPLACAWPVRLLPRAALSRSLAEQARDPVGNVSLCSESRAGR